MRLIPNPEVSAVAELSTGRMRLGSWHRARQSLVIASLTVVALLSVAAIGGTVQARIRTSVNHNWRGLYDILVTVPGEDFGATATNGLVDPNFVTTSRLNGISLSDLQKVRSMDGVEVAAPIGVVGALRETETSPYLALSDNVHNGATDLPGAKVLLKLTSTLTALEPQGIQVLARNSGMVLLPHRSSAGEAATAATPSTTNDFGALGTDQSYLVQLGLLPNFETMIVAVDPAAEAALRGPKNSQFLAPFSTLPGSRVLSGDTWSSLLNSANYEVQQATVQQLESQQGVTSYAVPMVVNEQALAPLRLTATARVAVVPDTSDPTDAAGLEALARRVRFSAPHLFSVDATSIAIPFTSTELGLLWPHSKLPGARQGAMSLPATNLAAGLLQRPTYRRAYEAAGQTGYRVVPLATVAADGSVLQAPLSFGSRLSASTAYRAINPSAGPGFADSAAIPVGRFGPQDLTDPSAQRAGYTPTGIAGSTAATLVRLADGRAVNVPVAPQYNGVDFLTAAPGAITDLAGGKQLRGSSPIDAIRVRVANVASYDPANVAKIERVAAQISRLGLEARVVAGSSLEPVAVYVPKYWQGRQGDAADLGWVRQEWTSLGAAVAVSSGLSGASRWLADTVLAALALMLVALGFFNGAARRREVLVLGVIGWRRRTVAGSLLRRDAPGAALILVGFLAGCLAFGSSAVVPGLILTAGTMVAAAAATATALRTPGPSPIRFHRARPLGGLRALALRNFVARPPWLMLNMVLVAMVTCIASIGAQAVAGSIHQAGSTRLADLVESGVAPWLTALAVGGVFFGALMQRRVARSEMLLYEDRLRVLRELGYRPRTLSVLSRSQLVLTLMSCAIAAIGVALVLSIYLDGWMIALGVGIAISIAGVNLVLGGQS